MRRLRWFIVGLSGLALIVSSATAQDESAFQFPNQIRQVSNFDVPPPPDVPAGQTAAPEQVFNRPAPQDMEPNWVNTGDSNQCNNCCRVCPQWYAQLDVLLLDRASHFSNQPVVLDDITGAVLLSTGDLNFNGAAGPRILLGRAADDCTACEFSYFGVYSLSAERTITDGNSLDIPIDLVVPATDFNNAKAMRVTDDFRLNSFELNCARFLCGSRPCGGVELLAGFRYLNLQETFNINSTDADNTISDYRIRTRNNLYGGQLGLRCTERWDRLGLSTTGKAGLFANDADHSQFVGDNGNTTILRNVNSSQVLTAFVADLNATLSYSLTDHLAIRGGYNVIWIQGVAVAPNQLDFSFNATSGTGVNSSGGVLLHGTNIGLEVRW